VCRIRPTIVFLRRNKVHGHFITPFRYCAWGADFRSTPGIKQHGGAAKAATYKADRLILQHARLAL